jgi:preprotein translocase subunit SecE
LFDGFAVFVIIERVLSPPIKQESMSDWRTKFARFVDFVWVEIVCKARLSWAFANETTRYYQMVVVVLVVASL